MYHYLYKILNNINNKIYIGIHSTHNLDDNYMGSGIHLRRAQSRYGIKNFNKTILYRFKSRIELEFCESIIVNKEFVERADTYNHELGGNRGWYGMVTVKDRDGNILQINKNDNRIKNGEVEYLVKNTVIVKDQSGIKKRVDKNDPRYLSGELVGHTKGYLNVKDKNGIILNVSVDDPRYLSGELVGINKNLLLVKDKHNNMFMLDKEDPKILTGELVAFSKNKTTVKDKDGNTMSVSVNDPRIISGELVGVMKGRKTGKRSKPNRLNPIRTCPHCNTSGKGSNMTRYHFDNCKLC